MTASTINIPKPKRFAYHSESGVGRIPIVEVGTHRVVGILSRHDLLKIRSARNRAEIDRT